MAVVHVVLVPSPFPPLRSGQTKVQVLHTHDQILTSQPPQHRLVHSQQIFCFLPTDASCLKDTPPAKRIKVEKESNGNKKSSSDKYSEPIKKSHLQLDDLPPELLPKHHENMLKRVSIWDAGEGFH